MLAGIQIIVLLTFSPLFVGIITKTKAFLVGKKGQPLLQPYYDLLKLFKKDVVYSTTSSPVLKIAPLVGFSTLLMSFLLFPLFGKAPLHFEGDIILFAYLLALGRFWALLAALDVGSSFAGMGASREATIGALSELAFFVGLGVLAYSSDSLSLDSIFLWKLGHSAWQPVFLLLFATFFLLLLTENSRMPIDDPNTHLELTMIHEAMILDYGGVELGFILYRSTLKLFLFMTFAVSLLWPTLLSFSLASLVFLFFKIAGVAVGVGIVESTLARIRLLKIPQFLIANFMLALLALLVALSTGGN